MALPNKLFSPVLSTCIGALVLLLLLLLFLLYKYNQVRFPDARQGLQGLPSLRGHTASAGSQGRDHSAWRDQASCLLHPACLPASPWSFLLQSKAHAPNPVY